MGVLDKDLQERLQAAKFRTKFKPLFMVATDKVPILLCEVNEVALRALEFLEAAADELQDHDIDVGMYADDT